MSNRLPPDQLAELRRVTGALRDLANDRGLAARVGGPERARQINALHQEQWRLTAELRRRDREDERTIFAQYGSDVGGGNASARVTVVRSRIDGHLVALPAEEEPVCR